jgi:hypothetical protein
MQSVCYCCPSLPKGEMFRDILVELLSIRFNENLFCSSQVVTCGGIVMVKLVDILLQLNMTKNYMQPRAHGPPPVFESFSLSLFSNIFPAVQVTQCKMRG